MDELQCPHCKRRGFGGSATNREKHVDKCYEEKQRGKRARIGQQGISQFLQARAPVQAAPMQTQPVQEQTTIGEAFAAAAAGQV
eukprot:187424-Pelagomonas_calceolata.AAC.2